MANTKRDVLEGLEGFTPGPWRSTDPNGFGTRHIRAGESPPAPIAEVLHWDASGSEANARLIARAPALVEEVRELREGLRKSLRLPELLLKSEEQSSAHSHGPRRAAEYDRRYRALFDEICALLPETGDE